MLGKNQQIISREKYIFSHDHFGHYSDLLEVSRDSKFKSGFFKNSPIIAQFVTGAINLDNNTLEYHTIINQNATNSYNTTTNGEITASYRDGY